MWLKATSSATVVFVVTRSVIFARPLWFVELRVDLVI